MSWRPTTPSWVMRMGLVALALPSAVIAAWTLGAPRSFYDTFPGGGRHWVAAIPPYNEHLMRDFGAASLAIAVFLIAAAVLLDRRVIQVALIAFIAGSLPHFGYHLTTTGRYSTSDNVASLGGFALQLVLSLALLALAREARGPSAAPAAYAPSPSRSSRS